MLLQDNKEKELVREAQRRSDYALAVLLEHNYSFVYKFLLKLTMDEQQAADITQDCMVAVIRKLNLYDPEKAAFSTWMIAVAKNLWIESLRRNKRRQRLEEKIKPPEEAGPADSVIEKDCVLSALRRLSEEKRAPLLMKHVLGYSYEEISAALRIPVGTVKSRIYSGVQFLKKELASDGE